MAKKTKRTAKRAKPRVEKDEGVEQQELPVQHEDVVIPGQNQTAHAMLTWFGPGRKYWYGMTFIPGQATEIGDHPSWPAMRAAIDAATATNWSYEFAIKEPPVEEVEPPEDYSRKVEPEEKSSRKR